MGIAALVLASGMLLGAAGDRVQVQAHHLGREARASLVRVAERALSAAERALEHRMSRTVDVTVAASVDEVPPEVRGAFHAWTVGIALPGRARIWIASDRLRAEPPDDLRSVLEHELVHVVLGDLEVELSGGKRRLPLWLHEGLAQYVAESIYLGGSEKIVWFRARTDRLLSWTELSKAFPADHEETVAAYAQSYSFIAFLARAIGMRTVLQSLRDYLSGKAENLDLALAALEPGTSYTHLTGDWVEDVKLGRGLIFLLKTNCFNILIVLAVPLLAIVLYKRFHREKRAAARLEAWERAQLDHGGDHQDEDG